MKFQKDRARIINSVNEFLEKKDYSLIYHLKEDILNNIENLLDTDVLDNLIEATYFIGAVDKVILIADEYFRNDYESYKVIYYYLLANICNEDIFQAVSFIKKSKILNREDVKVFYIVDGANYTNILYIDEKQLFFRLSMIIVNYIMGVSKEIMGDFELDKRFLLYRFFDMINMIYELGYNEEVVLKLSDDMKNIFMLEI